ncbi:pectinesterase [Ranunculus cassubicifolius]
MDYRTFTLTAIFLCFKIYSSSSSSLVDKTSPLSDGLAKAPMFDIVVAKDGTGNYTTIGEALDTIPSYKTNRTVIYVRKGLYHEHVAIPSEKTRITLFGDGIDKTIIRDNRSVVDGWGTYDSATVAVRGEGFIARDLTIENSSGPAKGQAVALVSSSNHSAFYRCSFLGYQDTLYVQSNAQFYKECDIYGTVDVVFGDANAVFQSCTFYARIPLQGQENVFTAQGRNSTTSRGGISIIGSKFTAAPELIPMKHLIKTYFGRPWQKYSRTIVMNSYIDDVVDPRGWLEMNGDFALSTLYYREYMNTGPSSDTSNRVRWPGYGLINSSTEAQQFTVATFIAGLEWLPETAIPFFRGLL